MPDPIENEPRQCHIRDNVNPAEINSINESICSGFPLSAYGKHYYCVFHLPTKDKSLDFTSAFDCKVKSIDASLLEIETHCLSADEVVKAKEEMAYDFRYVYFPAPVYLSKHVFYARAQFTQAIFTESVDFTDATFIEPARFDNAVFEEA